MTLTINPLLLTDSYKIGHFDLMKSVTNNGITKMYSNFTNRGTRVEGVDHVVFYGLQAWLTDLQEMFQENFFDRKLGDVLAEYREGIDGYVDVDTFDYKHITELWMLGYLPLEVKAVTEGSLVPVRVPSVTLENTHDDFPWLVNYLETWLSSSIWHPSTNATTALRARRLLDKFALETTGQTESVDFQFHDFSFRGLSNWQSAAVLGSAHLTSFKGSDNVPAKSFVRNYYPGDNGLVAASVVATEHSIMVLNGKGGEAETYRRLIKDNPKGILSLVSDTYNLWHVLTTILPSLRSEILSREGTLVIRPDSGDPFKIICGDDQADEMSPEFMGVIQLLDKHFGSTVNAQGYKVLNTKVGAIYGDSISLKLLERILTRLKDMGYASTNIVFGAGSFIYNGSTDPGVIVTRDTFNSAVKATWAEVLGQGVNLLKDPITDSGMKKSATGRLSVRNMMDGDMHLIEQATPEQEEGSLLQTVWVDGMFIRKQSLKDIRENLKRNTAILERAGKLN